MPVKSTIDLHLTPTNANIGVREIKLLDRPYSCIFISTVQTRYIVRSKKQLARFQ